jgi:carbamoyltransferase
MNILGISAFADASAAIISEGGILVAVEEERLNRIKHYEGMPWLSIKECLDLAGLTFKDVNVVAVGWNPFLGWATRVSSTVRSLLSSKDAFICKVHRGNGYVGACREILKLKKSLITRSNSYHHDLKIEFVDHHMAHAASSFLASPFDGADIIVADGVGESATLSFFSGEGANIRRLGSIRYPHSLGHLYASITGFLGFKMTCDEGQVMALAAFGQDRYYELFKRLLRIDHKSAAITLDISLLDYHAARQGKFNSIWCELTGMQPRQSGDPLNQHHRDLACSLQKCIEKAVFEIVQKRFPTSPGRALCAAGGLFLNSVLNGEILRHRNRPFFVQPAAGDDGVSLGAALLTSARQNRNFRREPLQNVFFGRSFTDEELVSTLSEYPSATRLGEDLYLRVAELITRGSTVGWFQGKMEFGPRALGHRSILANPTLPWMEDTLNLKVKHRENFRPFAASVLLEESHRFFEEALESPFMLKVFRFRNEYRHTFPAVTHVDYSCRLQTVTQAQNEGLYRLLCEINKLTGYGIVLNTSLNVSGDPIVHTPKEALQVLQTSHLDFLVMGNY